MAKVANAEAEERFILVQIAETFEILSKSDVPLDEISAQKFATSKFLAIQCGQRMMKTLFADKLANDTGKNTGCLRTFFKLDSFKLKLNESEKNHIVVYSFQPKLKLIEDL